MADPFWAKKNFILTMEHHIRTTGCELRNSPVERNSVMANRVLIITGDANDAKALQDVLGKAKDGSFTTEWVTQHDFLTNLPNRVLLNDRIVRAILVRNRWLI